MNFTEWLEHKRSTGDCDCTECWFKYHAEELQVQVTMLTEELRQANAELATKLEDAQKKLLHAQKQLQEADHLREQWRAKAAEWEKLVTGLAHAVLSGYPEKESK